MSGDAVTGVLIRLACAIALMFGLYAVLRSPAAGGEIGRLMWTAGYCVAFTFVTTMDLWRAIYKLRSKPWSRSFGYHCCGWVAWSSACRCAGFACG